MILVFTKRVIAVLWEILLHENIIKWPIYSTSITNDFTTMHYFVINKGKRQ